MTNDNPVAKAVAAILKRGAEAGTAIGVAGGMAAGGPAGAAVGGAITGLFGRLANDRFDKVESLDASLGRLRDALVESEKHIIVFIDDIDRLMPDELRQMLTLLKSLGNLPRVTYLVAYAREEVVELLKHARIDNSDYLGKIVQASFELPTIDRFDMRSLLFSRMNAILDGGSIGDQKRWGSSFFRFIEPYIQKPRDVALLCNALQVMWPATGGEVD